MVFRQDWARRRRGIARRRDAGRRAKRAGRDARRTVKGMVTTATRVRRACATERGRAVRVCTAKTLRRAARRARSTGCSTGAPQTRAGAPRAGATFDARVHDEWCADSLGRVRARFPPEHARGRPPPPRRVRCGAGAAPARLPASPRRRPGARDAPVPRARARASPASTPRSPRGGRRATARPSSSSSRSRPERRSASVRDGGRVPVLPRPLAMLTRPCEAYARNVLDEPARRRRGGDFPPARVPQSPAAAAREPPGVRGLANAVAVDLDHAEAALLRQLLHERCQAEAVILTERESRSRSADFLIHDTCEGSPRRNGTETTRAPPKPGRRWRRERRARRRRRDEVPGEYPADSSATPDAAGGRIDPIRIRSDPNPNPVRAGSPSPDAATDPRPTPNAAPAFSRGAGRTGRVGRARPPAAADRSPESRTARAERMVLASVPRGRRGGAGGAGGSPGTHARGGGDVPRPLDPPGS